MYSSTVNLRVTNHLEFFFFFFCIHKSEMFVISEANGIRMRLAKKSSCTEVNCVCVCAMKSCTVWLTDHFVTLVFTTLRLYHTNPPPPPPPLILLICIFLFPDMILALMLLVHFLISDPDIRHKDKGWDIPLLYVQV